MSTEVTTLSGPAEATGAGAPGRSGGALGEGGMRRGVVSFAAVIGLIGAIGGLLKIIQSSGGDWRLEVFLAGLFLAVLGIAVIWAATRTAHAVSGGLAVLLGLALVSAVLVPLPVAPAVAQPTPSAPADPRAISQPPPDRAPRATLPSEAGAEQRSETIFQLVTTYEEEAMTPPLLESYLLNLGCRVAANTRKEQRLTSARFFLYDNPSRERVTYTLALTCIGEEA